MYLKISDKDLNRVVHDITKMITLLKTVGPTAVGYALEVCEKELQEIRNDLLEYIDRGENN